jgi:hypothetical protein
MTVDPAVRQRVGRPRRPLGPAILVAVGGLGLASRYLDVSGWGSLLLPLLGLAFLLTGIGARRFGPLVPGGILLGLGVGLYLQNGALSGSSRDVQVGVVLLSFSAGWALISILSPLVRSRSAVWPLIPASALATGGVVLLFGVPYDDLWRFVDWAWPFALIVAGLVLLFRKR